MKNNYQKSYSVLTNLFLDGYFSEYKNFKQRNKGDLLRYLPTSYRKWFYSAFIEETVLTPHTVFDRLNRLNNIPSITMPSLRYDKLSREGFYFKDVTYSLSEHPISKDLITFLDLCVPDISLSDEDLMLTPDTERFAHELSLQDTFYVEYLFELSVHMKLISKIPSIYSNKAQITDKAVSLRAESQTDIFNKIFNAALELTSLRLKAALPENKTDFSKSYFLNLLKKPRPIDMIFQQVYSSLGINIDNFMTQLKEGGEDDDLEVVQFYSQLGEVLMSSTYMLGVLIDKYFLTPMGFYMRLIMPIYYLPFNFADEIIFLYESLKTDIKLETGLWSPCSTFFLTELGLSYLKVKKSNINHLKLPDTMPMEVLLSNITETLRIEKLQKAAEAQPVSESNVFEIKARLSSNKNIWFSFEIEETSTLDDVHDLICDMFILDYDADYSISIGEEQSPFLTYVSPGNNSRYKKADAAALINLNLGRRQKLIYHMPNTLSSLSWSYPFIEKKLYAELEITDMRSANPRLFYPQIIRKGKAFIKWEEDFGF